MNDQSIATRLKRLEDRAAIQSLVARYSLAVDDHDFKILGSLWAPDARYGFFGDVHAEGSAQIAALLEGNIGPGGVSLHTNHDHLIEWDESDTDRAQGVLSCHAEVTVAGEHQVAGIRYRDKYVLIDGQWLFAERFLGFLYFAPVEEYAGVLLKRERLIFPGIPAIAAHWPDFA